LNLKVSVLDDFHELGDGHLIQSTFNVPETLCAVMAMFGPDGQYRFLSEDQMEPGQRAEKKHMTAARVFPGRAKRNM